MRPLMLALALAGSLTLAVPALPVAAADTSSTAIEAAESAVERARRDMRAEFRAPPVNGRYVWKDGAGDVTRVVLDLSRQLAFAYDGGELIAVSTISSGDADHLSPVGVFPIMEKKRHHRSNRYNDAPMPYMLWWHQRPTDGGAWPNAHVHAHVAPLLRSPGTPRFVAAGELGSGVFFNPVDPAAAAEALRRA